MEQDDAAVATGSWRRHQPAHLFVPGQKITLVLYNATAVSGTVLASRRSEGVTFCRREDGQIILIPWASIVYGEHDGFEPLWT